MTLQFFPLWLYFHGLWSNITKNSHLSSLVTHNLMENFGTKNYRLCICYDLPKLNDFSGLTQLYGCVLTTSWYCSFQAITSFVHMFKDCFEKILQINNAFHFYISLSLIQSSHNVLLFFPLCFVLLSNLFYLTNCFFCFFFSLEKYKSMCL